MQPDSLGYVAQTTLTREGLAGLLDGDNWQAILRRVDACIAAPAGGVRAEIGDWEAASFFNADAEIRWRREGDCYDVLWLGEHEPPHGFDLLDGAPYTALTPARTKPHGLLLWGTKLMNDLVLREARVPRALEYPATGVPVIVYKLFMQHNRVRWVRLVAFEESR